MCLLRLIRSALPSLGWLCGLGSEQSFDFSDLLVQGIALGIQVLQFSKCIQSNHLLNVDASVGLRRPKPILEDGQGG
jgi:hypothetical protein